ncbi:MAG: hypothetical protein R6U88_04185 [Candidatus Bipolaricaulota bacterium]
MFMRLPLAGGYHSRAAGLLLPILLVWAVSFAGAAGNAEEKEAVKTLVVDETRQMASALQLQSFAGGLSETGLFDLKGVAELSADAPPPDPPYELVIVISGLGDQVWIVTPQLPSRLPPRLRAAAQQAKLLAAAIYAEHAERPREVVDVGKDFGVLLHAALWKEAGWLTTREDH